MVELLSAIALWCGSPNWTSPVSLESAQACRTAIIACVGDTWSDRILASQRHILTCFVKINLNKSHGTP